jgi:Ran GTPase-activating protein (RanGAP) involved in mRNA processing and transport
LRSEGLRHLADGIRRSKGLTTLNLSDNQITGGTDAKATEALTHFARALQVNQVLANINLMFNAIGIQGALALKIALTKVRCLLLPAALAVAYLLQIVCAGK